MYLDNEDTQYWDSEAQDAWSWLRVTWSIRRDIRRRIPGYSTEKYRLLDDIARAHALFYAQYYYALVHAELGHAGLTFSDLLAA